MPLVFYALCFGSAAVLGMASYPPIMERIARILRLRVERATLQLSDMFVELPKDRLLSLYVGAPVVCGLLSWVLLENVLFAVPGFGLGLLVPRMAVPILKRQRDAKFQNQLVDGLLVLSSCLKAGLSMLQAFTVVNEEMPVPISQEFGLVLKETRMGLSLDEALVHLKQRMPSDDCTLFVTAVLVARETGGDITSIFTQLVETIRERKKIKERIKTLTFMARLQGGMMAMLPFAFSYVSYSIDPTYFGFLLHDPTGQVMLFGVVFLQLLGGWLFMRFSRSPI